MATDADEVFKRQALEEMRALRQQEEQAPKRVTFVDRLPRPKLFAHEETVSEESTRLNAALELLRTEMDDKVLLPTSPVLLPDGTIKCMPMANEEEDAEEVWNW